jgi:cobalt-zinc-cadmium efflux system protein
VIRRGLTITLVLTLAYMLGDLLGSTALVITSVLIAIFGWFLDDSIFRVIIGVLILLSSTQLLWKVSQLLMEGTPTPVDLHDLCQRLEQEAGITGVNDIHAWSITTGHDAFSAYLTTDLSTGETSDEILSRLRNITSKGFGISHITIQLESLREGCLEDHDIEHPENSLLATEIQAQESQPHLNGHQL